MKKVGEAVKKYFSDKSLYIFLAVTILFFGIFFAVQYAPDTYSVFTTELNAMVEHFFSCGRYITGIALYITKGIFGASNETIYALSYIFAIICSTLSLYELNKILSKEISNKFICMLVTILLIINPFSLEMFFYVEKGIMMLSILLCVLAVKEIIKYFEGNKKAIIPALILMFIANCCYQGTVGLVVAISLIYIIKYSKNIKDFIINNIVVALVYGIPAVLNFITIRLFFSNSRVSGEVNLSESLSKILTGTKRMLVDTYDILPHFLFLAAIAIALIVLIYKLVTEIKENKARILLALGAVYIIVGTMFATIAPQMMQATDSIWFVARSSYPAAALLGLLIAYLFMNFKFKNVENIIIEILIILFLVVQYICFSTFMIDNYIGGYKDKEIALQIKDLITKYEEETGNKIDTISIYHDSNMQYVYPGLNVSGDMNIKAYSADWCVPQILKFYTGRDFKVVENNEQIKEDFSQNNWEYFDKDQIIFNENVMNLCVF